MKDLCNVQRLLWANDFPHSDSTWPHSQALLARHAAHLTDAERRLVLYTGYALTEHQSLVEGASGKLYRRTGKCEQTREYVTTAPTMYRELDTRLWRELAEAQMRELA